MNLIERLRGIIEWHPPDKPGVMTMLCKDAADEIERLTAERNALREKLDQIAIMADRAVGCSASEMDGYLAAISDAAIDAARKKE